MDLVPITQSCALLYWVDCSTQLNASPRCAIRTTLGRTTTERHFRKADSPVLNQVTSRPNAPINLKSFGIRRRLAFPQAVGPVYASFAFARLPADAVRGGRIKPLLHESLQPHPSPLQSMRRHQAHTRMKASRCRTRFSSRCVEATYQQPDSQEKQHFQHGPAIHKVEKDESEKIMMQLE